MFGGLGKGLQALESPQGGIAPKVENAAVIK